MIPRARPQPPPESARDASVRPASVYCGPLPLRRSAWSRSTRSFAARWVLPVEPDGRVLEDHAVAIRDGRIVAVLPTAEARARYRPAEVLERPHARAAARTGQRAHARRHDPAARPRREPAAAPWLQRERVWPVERRWVDPEYVRDGTELAIAEMLRGGVTCFADMQLWPEVVRAHRRRAAHARQRRPGRDRGSDRAGRPTADEYIDKRHARCATSIAATRWSRTHFAPHAPLLRRATPRWCGCAGSRTNSRSAGRTARCMRPPGRSRRACGRYGLRPLARLASARTREPVAGRRAHDAG